MSSLELGLFGGCDDPIGRPRDPEDQRQLPWDFSGALSHAIPGPPGRASLRPYLLLLQRHAE